ncbi:MAG: UvrD-helicase domain-containing protein [Gammaproteobacteria bacterium]|jgi:ATP-dependent DNA helicase Rep|nr:UvrD-helicase domain-containing protein [Gammaproteobacteria bacterium]
MAKPSKSTLNPQQRQAVEYCDGPLLVLAGAGSGKTRVITEKLAWLIQQRGIPASSIAAITFTNKAAKEMRQRASKLLPGQQGKQLQVSTFHALGWRMLREHTEQAGYRSGISILDETESTRLLRELLPDNTPPDQLRRQRWLISTAKNAALVEQEGEPETLDLLQRYQQQMQRLNAVDFDDLLAIPLQLLHQHKDIRYQWQQRLRHLLVDEYQDTNACQYQLLRLLAGDSGYLTVVGDDDQSIYGWRGAQPDNLRQLQQDFRDLQVIKLEQNYRCSSRILAVANTLIANNPHLFEKKLWSKLHSGDDPRIIPCDDGEQEVERITGDIHSRIQRGARAGQFAILYRSHHLARPFEQALRAADIRYNLTGGQSFFDRTEIRDLMAWLRLLVNPDDNPALLRVINTPRREIGTTTINHLADYARAHHCSLFDAAVSTDCLAGLQQRQRSALEGFTRLQIATSDDALRRDPVIAVTELIDNLHYRAWLMEQADNPAQGEKRVTAVHDWLGWLTRIHEQLDEPDLESLCAQLNLLSQLDDDNSDDQAVQLMTLHAAKGLEFDHVYMIAVEDGTLPHQNSLDEGSDQEERRLMYVGITRARNSLTCSYAKRRQRYGEMLRCTPSRFLEELPSDGIYWYGRDEQRDTARHDDARDNALAELQVLLDS